VLAGWCFVAVAVSGAVNAGVRLGAWAPLVGSAYGRLVLAKAAALVVLGGFGWWHRRRTVSALAAHESDATARSDARVFLGVAAVELLVMGATVALAVGLSRTPTPVGNEAATSRAAELIGFPMPAAPTLGRLLWGWTADGFAVTFLVLAVALYATGLRVLHRRGVRWPVGRTLSWYAGLLVVAWSTVGGLGVYSHVLFSAHMVAHMLLSMVAPIGLVLGAPVTLALRTLPGGRVPDEDGPRQLLLAVLHSRPVSVVSHPLVALALWVGSLYALYFTGIFPALMDSHLGHVAMELHFLAVGSLFFWTLIGVDPTPRRWHPLGRIGLLVAAMPFHAFFSIALLSGTSLLAPDYYRALARPYSTDLLADQHLGGGIGWALSEVPILLVVAAIFVQWVRADHREATRLDRSADRAAARAAQAATRRAAATEAVDAGGASREQAQDDPLAAYNSYLARLSARDGSRGDR
jgi:putative copper resistance protein D